MNNRFSRRLQLITILLIISSFIGALPWREIRADMNTHGEYAAYPLSVIYEQVSTADNSTQGEFTLTNVSEFEITSWTLEVDYFEDVTISNIWNASDITMYTMNRITQESARMCDNCYSTFAGSEIYNMSESGYVGFGG